MSAGHAKADESQDKSDTLGLFLRLKLKLNDWLCVEGLEFDPEHPGWTRPRATKQGFVVIKGVRVRRPPTIESVEPGFSSRYIALR